MKKLLYQICLFFIFLICFYSAYTQIPGLDSVKKVLQTEKEDTNKVKTLINLSEYYQRSHADTALTYAQQALALAEKINFEWGTSWATNAIIGCLGILGNYPLQLNYCFKALSLAKKINHPLEMAFATGNLSDCYYNLGEYNTSLRYWRETVEIGAKYFPDKEIEIYIMASRTFEGMHQPDSALLYGRKYYEHFTQTPIALSFVCPVLGNAFADKSEYDSALFYYRLGIPISIQNHQETDVLDDYNGIAAVYKATGNPDSALWYAKKVLNEKITKTYPVSLLKATNTLAEIYEAQNKPDSSLKYLKKAISIKDGLFNREKTIAVQNLIVKEQEKQTEVEAAKLQSQNRLKMYSLLGGLFTVLAIAGLLFRNNRQKQKANARIEKAYGDLKSTQSQLIQSEKMASLGELTAGIAHEIQNPLNFVNNFSEVNKEMIDELQTELKLGNTEEAIAISNDIKSNEEKINHHGKRADAIVKGMLQHSKQTSGTKEPTDINALCDEYLRLSYHGLRAKDKEFNANFKTEFDESIGKINIVPQDVGRVLLNLFNNAFYAVNEKQKLMANSYQPIAEVKTRRINDKIEITVNDNGNGIPSSIKDKIFQPFFTTKPTGQGTGLGLSLSYDIIKAHGGEIRVETKEGEGSDFIIQLPIIA